MASDVARENWYDEDRFYSSEGNDDSPILAHRYERYHNNTMWSSRKIQPEERHRRTTCTFLAKFFFVCTAMILFCVLLYIPVYNRANEFTRGIVGWSVTANRDTKIYVRPYNVTTIIEPKDICKKYDRNKKNQLFLLIVVSSSTDNFKKRDAIRNTWGNYNKYKEMFRIYKKVSEQYKSYNYTYDLYPKNVNVSKRERLKRDISGFGKVFPELAKALQNTLIKVKDNIKTEPAHEKRFDDDDEDPIFPEFDMKKQLEDKENEEENFDYDYESHVMKIPPKGYEEIPKLETVLEMLKHTKTFPSEDLDKQIKDEPVFKLVFLLGLSPDKNNSFVQSKIYEEADKYGDVVQEDFIDSYNNLTLKSIMMLKWITSNCGNNVRYVLKTDDDVFINVPNLMTRLQNYSRIFDEGSMQSSSEEYLLIGELICGAKPISHNYQHKWYSPRYMYSGRTYPRYLSGTGYVMSASTVNALYHASLDTSYFHLEDIFITGMSASRAHPAQVAVRAPTWYSRGETSLGAVCAAHAHIILHRLTPIALLEITELLTNERHVEICERKRLAQNVIGWNQEKRKYIRYRHEKFTLTEDC